MGSAIAGVVGANEASADRGAALAAQQRALQEFNNIAPPDIASQKLSFENYQNAGDFTNQNEQALHQNPTAMAGISTDPRLMQAQMQALQQLSQTGQMGMTPAEAAALNQAQHAAASQAQAKNAQIMDQYARTGMGGSGAQLAAQLNNSQAQAEQLAHNSNQVAQSAQQNALQAISQAGTLGGQMGAQQFGQQADIAKAKDYINRFNTENAQNVAHTNTSAANAATLRNLNNTQGVNAQNTQLANQQQQYNKQLLQQQFNNQTALAAGRAGQYNGIAQTNQQNAANTANSWAGIGQGVDTAAGAAAKYYGSSGGDQNEGFSNQEQNNWLNSGSSGEAANSAANDSADYEDAMSMYGG